MGIVDVNLIRGTNGATNRLAWWDSSSSISGSGASWFNGTQLSLGNTGQDTISNSRLYLYKATSDVSTGGYPHVLTLNNYTAGGDNAPGENFQVHSNTLGFNSGVTYSGTINTVNFNTLRFEGSAAMVMNTVHFNYNEIYSTNSSGTISNLIANRTKFANAANSGTLGSVFVYYNGNGDLTGFTNKWFLYNADDFVNSDIKGQVRITGTTNQNGLTVATGIKISNNTDSAATAGGGSLKYDSGVFYGSDGASWTAFGGGTPAGSNGQIQFNNSGSFGADSGLFWDNTTKYFAIGSSTTQITSEIFMQLVKNDNAYRSIGVQNKSAGALAAGDFTAVRDDGTSTTNFASFGINSSAYNDPSYPIQGAGSGYAFVNGGNMVIGTQTAHDVIFHTGGTTLTDRAMVIRGGASDKGYVGFLEGSSFNPTLLGKIHIINEDDTKGTFFIDRYSPTSGQTSVITIRKARGTGSAPSAVQSNDGLGGLSFRGYGTTAFSAIGRASLVGRAGENWTDASQGAYMQFLVTPNGGTATAEYMRLDSTSLYSPTATTFSIFNTVTTNLSIGGAATTIAIGATTGTMTLNNPTIVGSQATQALFNTVATTMNFAGASTTINVGATTGTLTLNNPTVVGSQTTVNLWNTTSTTVNAWGAATAINIGTAAGTITTASATLVGTQATQNVYNTVATTVNAFGAATAITIGATTGTMTLRNATIVGSNATQTLFNTTATTMNFAGAATAITIGATTGTLTLRNPTIVSSGTSVTLFDTTATTINFGGAATTFNIGGTTGSSMTLGIGGNTTTTGNTKTINFGLGGASGSTTAINIGSGTTGSTNNIKFNVVAGSDATGDIWYRNSSGFMTRLAIGTAGQVLSVSGGLPAWTTSSASPTSQGIATSTGQATVANSVTATTILGTASGSKTITGGTLSAGSMIRVTVRGTIATAVSAPTISMIVKYGSVTVGTTNPNNTGTVTGTRQFTLTFDMTIQSTGVSGTCVSGGEFRFWGATSIATPSIWEIQPAGGPGQTTNGIDTTTNQAIDVQVQWGTASNQNTITGVSYSIEQLR
jgi:hypothetical protein